VKEEGADAKAEPERDAVAVKGAAAVNEKQEAVKAEAKVEADTAAAAAGPPSDEALVARLNEMLGEVDFATTTGKHLPGTALFQCQEGAAGCCGHCQQAARLRCR
jgi:hypothetical protein